MQLRNKIIHVTGIFMLLLGIAGGLHLWLMQGWMRQVLVDHEKQNKSVLTSIDTIRTGGIEMIESVNHYGARNFQSDNFGSELEQMLLQFNSSYASIEYELTVLAGDESRLFCDSFFGEIENSSAALHQYGLQVFASSDEMAYYSVSSDFSTAEDIFLETIEKVPSKQAALTQDKAIVMLTQSKIFYWTYFGAWIVIATLATVFMNRFCNNITRRIGAMNRMVEKVGIGQFYIRLQDDQQDELAELARKMNDTAKYLTETRQNLEKTTHELALQLEERRAIEKKLADAATHDSLTGLPNRASFYEQFNHAIALADRQKANIALLFLDMDGLKIVNDAFGHDGGDMLIQQVGARLRGNIRKSDYVARLAGDEFVVILENLLKVEEDVTLVCTKLLTVLSEPYDIRGRRIKLTASIGVSLFPDHGSGVDELLRKADSAMYLVKNSGKNNFSVYEI